MSLRVIPSGWHALMNKEASNMKTPFWNMLCTQSYVMTPIASTCGRSEISSAHAERDSATST
jgi:hypothetical protein